MTRFHGHIRSWMFSQLDPGCGFRPVQRPPLRAYAGWHDEMQAEEPPPMSRDDLMEASVTYRPKKLYCANCIVCGAPNPAGKRGAKRATCGPKCAWAHAGNLRRANYRSGMPWKECAFCGRQHQRAHETCSPECRVKHIELKEADAQARREEKSRVNDDRMYRMALPHLNDTLASMEPGQTRYLYFPMPHIRRWIGEFAIPATVEYYLNVPRLTRTDSKDPLPSCLA